MSGPFKRLNPLRSRLKKHLSRGWERAVFREPLPDHPGDSPPPEEVIQGPGLTSDPDELGFDALWTSMHKAALEGRVKQVILLDGQRRLEIDARHASLRQKKRDAQTLQKMMGNKDRLFRPDKSASLLRELGLLNADGSMSRRHARKYKQVHHFVQLCEPVIERVRQDKAHDPQVKILDLACGNSYLGLVLLEALYLRQIPARLVGVDLNVQWIDASRDRAQNLPHLDATFIADTIEAAGQREDPALVSPDLVVALHACDTATDQAIRMGLQKRAPAMLFAPCCHAQVAKQLSEAAVLPGLSPLIEQRHLRRAYGELVTDALRVAWIEAHGYEVSVVEFVGSEHTSKNLLIRALRKGLPDPRAFDEVRAHCAQMRVRPDLICAVDNPAPGSPNSVAGSNP